MQRKDAVKALRRRIDFLDAKIAERKVRGENYSYEGQEASALRYALSHLVENSSLLDEGLRTFMSTFGMRIISPPTDMLPNREELEAKTLLLEKFSRSGFSHWQFKAGLVAEYIRGNLLK